MLNPVASANANPKIAYENNCPLSEGFLDTPNINAPKTTPIPTPAPIKPVVAKPVPIIFAACIKVIFYYAYNHIREETCTHELIHSLIGTGLVLC